MKHETIGAFGAEFLAAVAAPEYGCVCNDQQGMGLYVDGVYVGEVDASAPGGFRKR